MRSMTHIQLSIYLMIFLATSAGALQASQTGGAHADTDSEQHGEEHEHSEEHETGVLELGVERLNTIDVEVTELTKRQLAEETIAPGEVITNAYRSAKVTPRIRAQIVKRYKRLGQVVKKGDPLVVLSSVEMAQAQGELLVNGREWQRVKKLGKKVVSERRYVEAQVAYQQAYAKALAYGMASKQIDQLLKQRDPKSATGTFELLAPQAGTVISDDFIVGEIIEPGRVLFDITDESLLWVEARVATQDAKNIVVGAVARVRAEDQWMEGRVVQAHHRIDESTRTFPVRVEVPNVEDRLHPGMFVDARIQTQSTSPVLAVPQEALLRNPDGDWVIYIEMEPGIYRSQEIEVLRTVENYAVIKGINPGVRVVTKGAFFLQSETAKSSFDADDH